MTIKDISKKISSGTTTVIVKLQNTGLVPEKEEIFTTASKMVRLSSEVRRHLAGLDMSEAFGLGVIKMAYQNPIDKANRTPFTLDVSIDLIKVRDHLKANPATLF